MSPDPFYTRFFPNQDSDAQAGFHRVLQRRLPHEGKVLDLGCGDHTELAAYRTDRREVWGADFQRHPQQAHPEWFLELWPDGGIPFAANTFDVVACAWVLEHVAAPERFLAEVYRVLRPGGWFVALTPNAQHYVTWITRAVGLLPHPVTQAIVERLYGRPHHDTFPTHYRLNTPRRLRHAASKAGLRLTRTAGFANPDYFRVWEPLRQAAVAADWLLDGLRPGLGRLYWVASFRKPEQAVTKEGPPASTPRLDAAWWVGFRSRMMKAGSEAVSHVRGSRDHLRQGRRRRPGLSQLPPGEVRAAGRPGRR